MTKLHFQSYTSFRNHSERNISYYYQCWKQLCCLYNKNCFSEENL